MTRILVAGLINIETTLQVEAFPIDYAPVHYPFFGIKSTVSGVGYNVAKALTTLGDAVDFLSLVGRDFAAKVVRETLTADRIPGEYVIEGQVETAQSVILYDKNGRRQINVDLKNIQETSYPEMLFERALAACEVAALCNINFSRPFLHRARALGKLVATDVHTISSLDDDYNRDYMANADILFMSHERLSVSPSDWASAVHNRFGTPIVVIAIGGDGALLSVRDTQRLRVGNFTEHFQAVQTRPIVNTIGAGDALFSAFVHYFARAKDPRDALKRAMVFASYKIGAAGAADGFLDEPGLEELYMTLNHAV